MQQLKLDAAFAFSAALRGKEVASRNKAMQFEKLLKNQKGGQGFTTLLRGMEQ